MLIDRACIEAYKGQRATRQDEVLHSVPPDRRQYVVVVADPLRE